MPSNHKHMKAKTLFITDIIVLITLLLTSVSGLLFHIAGHQENHDYWHNCAIVHIVSSLALTISVSIHIYGHWGWYKSLIAKGRGNKSRVTIYLSSIYIITIITGFVLLNISGANTNVGLWHYRIGIILTIISAGHIIKRIPILRKSLKK